MQRDLKPQNLLLATPAAEDPEAPPPTLKIADFGFARALGPQLLAETLCGSPLYMAPEILLSQRYDAKADLWSVGAIFFEAVSLLKINGKNHSHFSYEYILIPLHSVQVELN